MYVCNVCMTYFLAFFFKYYLVMNESASKTHLKEQTPIIIDVVLKKTRCIPFLVTTIYKVFFTLILFITINYALVV